MQGSWDHHHRLTKRESKTISLLLITMGFDKHFWKIFFLFSSLIIANVSSSEGDSTTEASNINLDYDNQQCSAETCQDLRDRVVNLEEALRTIISTLSSQKSSPLLTTITKSIKRNSAVRSIMLPSKLTNEEDEDTSRSSYDPISFPNSFNCSEGRSLDYIFPKKMSKIKCSL